MENKNIKRFYELVQSDETLKRRLLQADNKYENKELTYENFLDMVNNNIIPIAKEYGITLTQEEIINETKAGLNKLSDEDLMDVSGGVSPRMAALTLSTVFLMSLGSGSVSSLASISDSDTSSIAWTSSSENSEERSNSRGIWSTLRNLPSSLRVGFKKVASLFNKKETGDRLITDNSSYRSRDELYEEDYESDYEILSKVPIPTIGEMVNDGGSVAEDEGENGEEYEFNEGVDETQTVSTDSDENIYFLYEANTVKELCDNLIKSLNGREFSNGDELNTFIDKWSQKYSIQYEELINRLEKDESLRDLKESFYSALVEHIAASSSGESEDSDETARKTARNDFLWGVLDKINSYLQDHDVNNFDMYEVINLAAPDNLTQLEKYLQESKTITKQFIKRYNEIIKNYRSSQPEVSAKESKPREDKRNSRSGKEQTPAKTTMPKYQTPAKATKSKSPRSEEQNIDKILNETLFKIKKFLTENPEFSIREPVENIISASIKNEDEAAYINNFLSSLSTEKRKEFDRKFLNVAGSVAYVWAHFAIILKTIEKEDLYFKNLDFVDILCFYDWGREHYDQIKSSAEKDLAQSLANEHYRKIFEEKYKELYRKKISSMLEGQDKSKSIEEIADTLLNNDEEKKEFIYMAKKLGFAKKSTATDRKDRNTTSSHQHSDRIERKQTSPGGNLAPASTGSHKEAKERAEKSSRRHHRASEGAVHGAYKQAEDRLSYEELLQIAQSAIQGLAVGDAAGVPFEFKERKFIKEEDLPNNEDGFTKPASQESWWGGYDSNVQQGYWSDDTSMTLCLMRSIAAKHGKVVPNDVMDRFVKWKSAHQYAPNGYRFDIGGKVESEVKRYADLTAAHGPIKGDFKAKKDNSAGNGALMRIMPMAFYLAAHPEISEEDGIELIKDIAELTHNDICSYSDVGCIIYTLMNKNLILDRTKDEPQVKLKRAFDKAIETTKKLCETELQNTEGKYDRLLKGYDNFAEVKKYAIRTDNGFIPVTLESVMYSLIHSSSYMDCIRKAILMGFDTDTVASIAGGTAGILYKLENIPTKWKEQLVTTRIKDKHGEDRVVSIEKLTENFIKALFPSGK